MTDREIVIALKEMFVECAFGKDSLQCEGCKYEKKVCCDDALNDITELAADMIDNQAATISALRAEVEGAKNELPNHDCVCKDCIDKIRGVIDDIKGKQGDINSSVAIAQERLRAKWWRARALEMEQKITGIKKRVENKILPVRLRDWAEQDGMEIQPEKPEAPQ